MQQGIWWVNRLGVIVPDLASSRASYNDLEHALHLKKLLAVDSLS